MHTFLLRLSTQAGSPVTTRLAIDSEADARTHWQREVHAYRDMFAKGLFVRTFTVELLASDGEILATETIHPPTT